MLRLFASHPGGRPEMGIKNLFHRKNRSTTPARPTPYASQEDSAAAAKDKELEDAWAELNRPGNHAAGLLAASSGNEPVCRS